MKKLFQLLLCLCFSINSINGQGDVIQKSDVPISDNEFIKVDIPVWGSAKYYIPNVINVDLDTLLGEGVFKIDADNCLGMSDYLISFENRQLKLTGHVKPDAHNVVITLKGEKGELKSVFFEVSSIHFGAATFLTLSNFEKITTTPISALVNSRIKPAQPNYILKGKHVIEIEAGDKVQKYETTNISITEENEFLEPIELTRLLEFSGEPNVTFRHYFYVNGHEILIRRTILQR